MDACVGSEKMVGGGFMRNGDDNTTFYEDVFDKIEDFLDFSNEELQLLMEPQHLCFEDYPPLAVDPNSGVPPVAVDKSSGPGAGVAPVTLQSEEETFPCEEIDVAELEWLSNFVEESFCPATTIDANPNTTKTNLNSTGVLLVEARSDDKKKVELLHYRTPSPVSVLEHNGVIIGGEGQQSGSNGNSSGGGGGGGGSWSCSSSSSCSQSSGTGTKASSPQETVTARGHAPRTKRPRPASVPLSLVLMGPSPISDHSPLIVIPPVPTAEKEQQQQQQQQQKKKKKAKLMISCGSGNEESSTSGSNNNNVRKCMHCEIQKTPQWRAGPMGPKTLCNACGVRYKSGRLFPEYRPAASPTFVASQHSNSHKKVIEMRVRSIHQEEAAAVPVSVKGCELINYIRSS